MTPKERPIIFSAEMVRAILEGRKTQTRRPIKPQPREGYKDPFCCWTEYNEKRWFFRGITPVVVWPTKGLKAPGWPGDRLWVKETWRNNGRCKNGIQYKADMPEEIVSGFMWKSPIYMPRWASRITLEIMEDAARAVLAANKTTVGPIDYFRELWDSIYAKKGFGWDMKPWVWVIKFKKLEDAS